MAHTAEWRLLHPTSSREPNRQSLIYGWLDEINIQCIEVNWPTRAGPADLYLPNRRCIIEVKSVSRLKGGPAKPGSGSPNDSRPNESAYEQVERYVLAERKRERLYPDDDYEKLPWLGMVTDGSKWWVWEWPPNIRDHHVKKYNAWNGRTLTEQNVKQLVEIFARTIDKKWAPKDPTELFTDALHALRQLYDSKKDERDVITQQELWYRQLKMSGNQPAEQHKDELFVLHTLLIAVSTKILELYDNANSRYGFATWTKSSDWLPNLEHVIKQYNWKRQTGDVLRALYMGLVDKKDRHIYGEYYTPDWLAEKMCQEIIDDDYIEGWIQNGTGGGVMDPASGSGTFLYHAVRRILRSKPVRTATISDQDLANMLADMIRGIDIHPVAVAMTKANIMRALPARPNAPLRIYQGDSLQINRSIQQKIDEPGKTFKIVSRKGTEIRLPVQFVLLDDFDGRMHRFTAAAFNQRRFPPGVDDNISDEYRPILYKAFETLTRICRTEGDNIWAWYTINHVGIYRLNGTISRIVTNPPWVRMSNIQDKKRKDETTSLAKKLNLWTGGKNATGFNIASLFVVQCEMLYGSGSMRHGWVLPDAAMRGGNWEKYIDKVEPSAVIDLGDLPFPKHSKACVNMFGTPERKPYQLALKPNKKRPEQRDDWETVRKITKAVPVRRYYKQKSQWFDGKRPIARNGATIFPQCLVVLDRYATRNGMAIGTTRKSIHGKWKGMSFGVRVPMQWVKKVLFSKGGLLPYRLGDARDVILPIDDAGAFLPSRNDTKWWRDASDKYGKHRGKGKRTPKTLESNLDYGGKLRSQFPMENDVVVYNKSGSNLSAARLDTPYIIDGTLYRVKTKSEDEALFLTGILNADGMRDRFKQTRRSDRDFHTYFWHEIPIPRYDKNNADHLRLVGLVKRAERIAHETEPKHSEIKNALKADGVSQRIDNAVLAIIEAQRGPA